MLKKYFFLFIFAGFNFYGQSKVIDFNTRLPIPMVHVISSNGIILGITDFNGVINIEGLLLLNQKDNIELSHVSYKNKTIELEKLIGLSSITLNSDENNLEEVVISSKGEDPDYLVLKGYYRSYQLDNKIPKAFSDGLIEYFIPLKGNNLKFHLIENRSFKNKNLFDQKGIIYTDNATGPPYIENNILLSELKDYKLLPYGDNSIIISKTDSIGFVQQSAENKTTTIHIDFFTPKRTKTKTLMNKIYKFTNISVSEIYYGVDGINDKSKLSSRTRYVKRVISHKKNKSSPITVESLREFYVFEKRNAFKSELKNIETSSYFGPHKTDYSSEYWNNLENYGIPLIPEGIQKLLGTKLLLDE